MRGPAVATRTFWWDRTGSADADEPLRAVIFDIDAIAHVDADGELAPRPGLIDLVMSLFVAGVWIGVVSRGRRTQVEPLVRELMGDGLVETIVTSDDADSTDSADHYELALWELGIEPESALAVVGSAAGIRATAAAGLATVVVSTSYDHLSDAAGCERAQRRWSTSQKRAA